LFLGNVVNGAMKLNDAGILVNTCWQEIPKTCPYVEIDYYIVMPYHLHGILIIDIENVGAPPCGRTELDVNTMGQARGPAPTPHV
jgi:hypothetical protein